MSIQNGRGDKIRTCDFYVPNVALYQAEPHLDVCNFLCRYGQICGQATFSGYVRIYMEAEMLREIKVSRLCHFKRCRDRSHAPEPSALPSCATPRDQIIIAQSVAPVKRRRAKFTIKKQVRRRRAQRTGKMPALLLSVQKHETASMASITT